MSFSSKQAITGGTTIATEVISTEHYQKVIPVGIDGGVEPNSTNYYNSTVAIVPTTLTTGLSYFVIRNPDAIKKIKINRIVADAFFVGTAAASRSVYVLKKYTSVTSTTGTTINIANRDSSGSSSIAEVKWLATGLTITGGVDVNNISHIGHANQLTANMNKDWVFGSPIVLAQNEALVVQSEGAIVAGSTVIFSLQFYEI